MRKALTALILAVSAVAFTAVYSPLATPASAASCKDIIFIFARGSGQNLNAAEYQSYRSSVSSAMAINSNISYGFYELGSSSQNGHQYPAIALNFFNTISAAVSAGSAFSYGESVNEGIAELENYISKTTSLCQNTKFVLSGYSQGAQVVSLASEKIDSSKIIYLATFGDPKLYLPEGQGVFPDACRGTNLSPYREYAPNCHTYQGSLGAKIPYESTGYSNKVGLWCNDKDLVCGAGLQLTGGSGDNLLEKVKSAAISAHTSYATKNIITSAAKTIAEKIHIDSADSEDKTEAKLSENVVLFSRSSFDEDNTFVSFTDQTIMTLLSKPGIVDIGMYDDCPVCEFEGHESECQACLNKSPDREPLLYSSTVYGIDNRNLQNQYSLISYSATIHNSHYSFGLKDTCNLFDYLQYHIEKFTWEITDSRKIYVISDNLRYRSYLADQKLQDLIADAKQQGIEIIFVSPANALSSESLIGLNTSTFAQRQSSIQTLKNPLQQFEDSLLQSKNVIAASSSLQSRSSATIFDLFPSNNTIAASGLPEINHLSYGFISANTLSLEYHFGNDTALAYLAINDAPLGLTALEKLEITDVAPGVKLTLTPIGKDGALGKQVELYALESRGIQETQQDQSSNPTDTNPITDTQGSNSTETSPVTDAQEPNSTEPILAPNCGRPEI